MDLKNTDRVGASSILHPATCIQPTTWPAAQSAAAQQQSQTLASIADRWPLLSQYLHPTLLATPPLRLPTMIGCRTTVCSRPTWTNDISPGQKLFWHSPGSCSRGWSSECLYLGKRWGSRWVAPQATGRGKLWPSYFGWAKIILEHCNWRQLVVCRGTERILDDPAIVSLLGQSLGLMGFLGTNRKLRGMSRS